MKPLTRPPTAERLGPRAARVSPGHGLARVWGALARRESALVWGALARRESARVWGALARRESALVWRFLAPLALVLWALLPVDAWARPGGGHTYSGGRGGSGGYGGGGGDGGVDAWLVYYLVRFLIEKPQIGIPVLIIVGAWWLYTQRAREARGWSTTVEHPRTPHRIPVVRPPHRRLSPQRTLERLRELDPDFSIVLFEDFLYALYAKAQEARGKGELETLLPYLSDAVRAEMKRRSGDLREVRTVVIGAMRYLDTSGVSRESARVRVQVEFEANYTEVARGSGGAGLEQTYYVVEHWTLERNPQARSRPPDKTRVFGCPSCGAPLSELKGNVCSYCGNVVDTGEFDWRVVEDQVLKRERRPPQLTSDVEELGTELPTIADPDAHARLQGISRRDPAFDWSQLEQRVGLIFGELQAGWSSRDWSRARPFTSDNLFQMLLYWIEAYKRAGLRNLNEDAHITAIELARVTSDAWYDAITIRLHASGLDYTVTDRGEVVSGSRRAPRAYTEYWTLIRGTGTRGKAHADKNCPSCGAGLKISMAGNCEFCGARVTSGEFDWVLSRIEQDETYQG